MTRPHPLHLLLLTPLLSACAHAPAAPPPPAPAVAVVTAQGRDVAIPGEWVATLDGYVNANISSQVGGYVIKQDYAEGRPVRKDQVLFEIDPRPFQAALDQAHGQLAQARGQVAQAEAQVKQQQAQLQAYSLDVARDQPEAAAHAIAQSQLQNDQQAEQAAKAGVTAAQASVEAANAAVQTATATVEQAQLNLGFTQVRSLIDGVAGIAQVQIGNLVTPQTVLTQVSALDPIKAYFPISAQDYARSVSRAPGAVNLVSPAQSPPLTLVLADGSIYPHTGHVLFADRQVDQQTGTLRVAAAFPNPGNLLRPGQYARVRATTEMLRHAVVVPQSAVAQLQSVYQIAVVGADNRVTIRTVVPGPTLDGDWIIASGLGPGERVVADGTAKVRPGMLIRPLAAAASTGRP